MFVSRRLIARLRRAAACSGGVAATEFALCLPFLLGAGLMGLDLANRAIVQTQVSQLAAQIADKVAVMYCGRIVETADVETIFARPAHPYTQGLLRSIPSGNDGAARLYQIPGSVPAPSERGPGCAFYPRCPLHQPVCLTAVPPLFPLGGGQSAACYVAAGKDAEVVA